MSVLVVGIIKLLPPPLLLPLLPLASPEHCGQPSPKKYATNCLNSPTNITYSSYFVCRRRQRLTLDAFMSRNFSHVLKLKTFLLLFSGFSFAPCVCCFYLLSNTGQQLFVAPGCLSLCSCSLFLSLSLHLSLSPYLCLRPRAVK